MDKKRGWNTMKKRLKLLLIYLLIISFTASTFTIIQLLSEGFVTEAHSGRTDSSGGHKDNKNKSGLGGYHYHCGGNPAHLHKNGVCPYSSKVSSNTPKSNSNSLNKTTSTNTQKELIKKVQTALNDLGYNCGKVDGVIGKKTEEAIKQFQKDNNLTVDGKIGKEVKDTLNIK
jgi:hypothetical protein